MIFAINSLRSVLAICRNEDTSPIFGWRQHISKYTENSKTNLRLEFSFGIVYWESNSLQEQVRVFNQLISNKW